MNLIQNTPEWLEFRQMKIGASDAPSIMGVGFHTPYKLWRIKIGFDEIVVNRAMQRGKEMEELARKQFSKETGIEIFPKVVQHNEFEWMIASLDGISFDGKTIVEIKCPGIEDHSIALQGNVPKKYYPQIQHQIAVTGVNSAIYYSFRDNAGVSIKVERDEKYLKELLKQEKEFYQCMIEFFPPQMTDKDFVNQNSEIWQAVCRDVKDCKNKLEELEAREKALKDVLIKLSKGQNSTGYGVRLTKIIRKGIVNYKAIPELQKIDLKPYIGNSTEYWKMTLN